MWDLDKVPARLQPVTEDHIRMQQILKESGLDCVYVMPPHIAGVSWAEIWVVGAQWLATGRSIRVQEGFVTVEVVSKIMHKFFSPHQWNNPEPPNVEMRPISSAISQLGLSQVLGLHGWPSWALHAASGNGCSSSCR